MALEMLAAEHFKEHDAPPLLTLPDEMYTTSDAAHYVERNHQFHVGVYRIGRSSRLLALIEELRNASMAYNHLYAAADVPKDAERLNGEHREILAACQANDPARAANAVCQHIQQTIVHVKHVLEQGGKA